MRRNEGGEYREVMENEGMGSMGIDRGELGEMRRGKLEEVRIREV